MTTGPEHSPDVRDETLPGQQADRTPAATPDDTPTSKRTLWPRRPNGIRPSGTGVARVLVTGALLGGLVAAASTSSAVIDLARPGTSTDTETGQASQALATNSALTCVGPELSGVKGAPDIPQEITVAGEAAPTDLTKASGTGSLRLAAGQTPPVVTDTERHLSTLVSAASPVTVTATGGVAPGLAALQQFGADTKDLRGLATTPCASASAESWLIAGGGAPGRQERLLLANPGANEITVDVNVIGAEGPVASDNGRGIVVPGRGRTNVLVDAIAGGEPSPVLQVTVRGGAVVAALSDVWLDGSVAAGLEMTVPTESPDTTLILPIVDLTQAPCRARPRPSSAHACSARQAPHPCPVAECTVSPVGPPSTCPWPTSPQAPMPSRSPPTCPSSLLPWPRPVRAPPRATSRGRRPPTPSPASPVCRCLRPATRSSVSSASSRAPRTRP
jgi:hypothetical protein